MTTKEALDLAIKTMSEYSDGNEYKDATKLLKALQKRELATKWSKESIVAALENWREKNGRPPTTTNLIEPGMPGSSTIQKHFGMRASALLRLMYPPEDLIYHDRNTYGFLSSEDWLNCFKEQFEKHCSEEGFSSKTYNMKKDKGTPQWETIARHCGTTQWMKLMEMAEVKYPGRIVNGHITTVNMPFVDRLEAALRKKEELTNRLIETIERNSRRRI